MGASEALHYLFRILVLHRSKCYEPGLPRGRGRGTLWFVGVTRTTVETPCGAGGIKGPASLAAAMLQIRFIWMNPKCSADAMPSFQRLQESLGRTGS